MPTERNDGSADLEDIKATINAERAAKPAAAPKSEPPPPERSRRAVTAPPADEPDDDEGEEDDAPSAKGKSKPAKEEGEGEPPAKGKRDWRDVQRDRYRTQAKSESERATAAEKALASAQAETARLAAIVERANKGEAVDPKEARKPKTEAEI